MRVAVHLALVDQTLLAFVHELDRIFDGQDMLESLVVDVVHHRRQRGGLARTRRAGHQHDAAWLIGDILECRRTAELFERQDGRGNGTEYPAGAAIVVEGVDAETRQIGNLEGKVGLQKFLVVLTLLVVHDVVNETVDRLMVQRRHIDAAYVAVDTNHGWQARGNV